MGKTYAPDKAAGARMTQKPGPREKARAGSGAEAGQHPPPETYASPAPV